MTDEAIGDPRVRRLALELIEQFSDERAELLERWLAFRIAELVFQIDNAPDDVSQAKLMETCTDLVFQVWRGRRRWERGWPPESAAAIIDALRTDRNPWEPSRRNPADRAISWTDTLSSLQGLQKEERRVWQLVAVGSTDVSDTESWLNAAAWAMEDDEETTLTELSEVAAQYRSDLGPRIRHPSDLCRAMPSDPDTRKAWLKTELEAIYKKKIDLLDSVLVETSGDAL